MKLLLPFLSGCSRLCGLLIMLALCAPSRAQVNLNNLTDLTMAPFGADFQHITVDSTGQLLTRIGPSVWQGNADFYPIDPTVTSPSDNMKRAGHYWSQFLMIGTDPSPEPGQVANFLTDAVQSEGQTLESFNVLQSSGKVIEYEGTWTFRDLFTTAAHHWKWVEGQDHYHRVRVSLDVLNPINNVRAIWTELLNFPDGYGTVTVDTRDDGLQTQSSLGTTGQHHFGQFELGRDDWIAFTDPQDGQAGSVARALLSSQSDIRTDDEVTPIWADIAAFDNIELHVHRQIAGGVNMTPGTSFFMDNLMITNPTLNNTNWVDSKIARGKKWIDLIGPTIDDPTVVDPGDPVSRFFVAPGGTGIWNSSANWTPAGLPDANDTVIVNVNREVTLGNDVGSVGALRLGDNGAGTLNVITGGSITFTDRAMVGLGGGANTGSVTQSGGSIAITGSDPVLFLAFDTDDTADYQISGGELTVGNLWFRFGNGTFTQTGGAVNATQLILGEGGNTLTSSLYDLQDGTFDVSGNANIGRAPGGENFPGSDLGTLQISGGVATFGDLLFGSDPTDQVIMSDTGILRVEQTNYSLADAMADIAANNVVGTGGANLALNTVDVEGTFYTEIAALVFAADFNLDGLVNSADLAQWKGDYGLNGNSDADGDGDSDGKYFLIWQQQNGMGNPGGTILTAVPEPASLMLMLVGTVGVGLRTDGHTRGIGRDENV